jgi:hypothetical protein
VLELAHGAMAGRVVGIEALEHRRQFAALLAQLRKQQLALLRVVDRSAFGGERCTTLLPFGDVVLQDVPRELICSPRGCHRGDRASDRVSFPVWLRYPRRCLTHRSSTRCAAGNSSRSRSYSGGTVPASSPSTPPRSSRANVAAISHAIAQLAELVELHGELGARITAPLASIAIPSSYASDSVSLR